MANGAAALQEFHDKSQDSFAERWEDTVNRMKNIGVTLGTTFLPVLEKIVDKIGAVTMAFTGVDTSKLENDMNSVADTVGFLIDRFIGAVKLVWQFRGFIIAVVGAIVALTVIMKAIELGTAIYNGVVAIATGFQIAYGIVIQKNTAAQAAYTFASNGAKIATVAWTAVLKIGTAAQWLMNAAMSANPIGLVIAAIAALIVIMILLIKNWDKITAAIKNNTEKALFLISIFTGPFGYIISIIKELITNWSRVTEAFEEGGILKAILKIGQVILSGILAPVQGLLEILSHIPGLGKLAGKGAEKIAEFRNSLLGEDANITAKIKVPKEAETALQPPDLDGFQDKLSGMDMPAIEAPELPEFSVPDFTTPAAAPQGGSSALHGVVDVSNGAAGTPVIQPLNDAAFPASAGAPAVIASPPQSGTVSALLALTAVVRHIDASVSGLLSPRAATASGPPPLLAIDPLPPPPASVIPATVNQPPQSETITALLTLTAVVRHIDAQASGILSLQAAPLTIQIPELAAVAEALRTTRVPRETGIAMGAGNQDAGPESPRNTAPITREERAYILEERRDTVGIEVSAAQGTSARITRRPRSANIRLATSGGNG
jgi:hypothetical protein